VNSKNAIEALIEKVNSNPADLKSAAALGMAYIQEARITGKHSYYDGAAINLFDKVLEADPVNLEALIGKGTVLLSQHHFTDAIPVAEKAMELYPHNSAVYGLLTDAFVETGEYNKAVHMADAMSMTRPDMRSYSRISYLREIYGDYPGAISAMTEAVQAGYPGLEQTEWCRYQLGCLYEKTGNLQKADMLFDQCIYYRPAFAFAYAGKGRIQKAKGNFNEAIRLTRLALNVTQDFSFQQQLTGLYRITNQQQLAAVSARRVIEMLAGTNGTNEKGVHGHYADRELAFAYIDAYDYVNALKHAQIEYNRRPDNIDVNHTLAWAYYKFGDNEKAEKYIDNALRTNCMNPVLLAHAAEIKISNGKFAEAGKLKSKCMMNNKYAIMF
jgi:tetratricopeptide (TPR) repeat protein